MFVNTLSNYSLLKFIIKYVGCIGINESMKSLSFEVRTQVARY